MKLLLAKLSLSAASLIVVAGLLEGALRLAGFQPERPVNPLFSWTGTEGELWRFKPGRGWRTRVGNHPVLPNAYGLREREIGPKEPGVFRILVLGDSVTFGHGQPVEVTFARQLEQILADKEPRIEVLNAGIPGWSTYQERLFYEQYGESLAPDLVLVAFVLNDVTEIHEGLLELSAEKAFWAIHSINWLAERSSIVAATKRLYAMVFDPKNQEIGAVSDLVRVADSPEVRYAMDLTLKEFTRIAALARQRDEGFGMILFPFRFQFSDPSLHTPQRELVEFAAEDSIPILDTLPELRRYEPDKVLMDHDHFTKFGHRVVAESIAKWLEHEGLLPVRR